MKKDIEKERDSRQGYSTNIIEELDMENLRGFYMRSKRDQLDFWAFFGINESTKEYIFELDNNREVIGLQTKKWSKILERFEEHCEENKVHTQDVYKYDCLLLERIRDIETVIDAHFFLIKEVIEEEKLEKRERDIEKTFGKEDYR